jgi:hypothetical protein
LVGEVNDIGANMMVPWNDVINFLGFNVSYVKNNKMWNWGFHMGWAYKRFNISLNINPTVKDDYELS